MNSSYIPLKIVQIRPETEDTKSFILQPLDDKPIRYNDGQFLTLVFPKNGGEERRSYSISSTTFFNEPLTITVKRIANGEYSRFLFDRCNVGDILYTIGPSGFFTLPAEMDRYDRLFFFAAGSGIVPIIPLIKTALYTEPSIKVFLVYSNKTVRSSIFLNLLRELQTLFPETFHADFLFSTSKDLLQARLGKLQLTSYLQRWAGTDKRSGLFYMCGPHHYMQMIFITLLTEGVPPENIRKEIFNTEKMVVKEKPPDQDEHQVTVFYEGQTHKFAVQYPITILAAAKKAGIFLPYSCEAGKCGTCSATCLKGKVWMSYNEVLLEKELENGRVLTCVGYPIGGDAVLDFPKI